jgi:hypothetical protein
VLERFAPGFHAALARYPQAVPPGAKESFSWALLDVQDRPTVVLVHRLLGEIGADAVQVERQFYASQGFDALQIVAGALPVAEGTVLLYANRTSTDQAARYGRMAQSIGRRMLLSEVKQHFAAVREDLGG